jgi:hypothetical protein
MPKLNITHLVGCIEERIEQLGRGDALEARVLMRRLSEWRNNSTPGAMFLNENGPKKPDRSGVMGKRQRFTEEFKLEAVQQVA